MKRLFEAFAGAGRQLFLVGGAVRDRVMGCDPEALVDLDFATDAPPDESLVILKGAGLSTFPVGKRFGTVGGLLRAPGRRGRAREVQVTTFRPDREAQAAGVERGESLDADLSRRDFRMNAMAMGPDGAIIDPWGGREDIAGGVIRAVGPPERMLRDDPLRMLRIGRFVATLGFEVDEALVAAARARAPSILEASRERWLQEMDKLLLGEHAPRGLAALERTGALAMVLPEVQALVGFHESCPVHHKDIFAHTLGVVAQVPPDPVLRWAALLHDVGKVWTRTVEADGTVRFIGHEALGAMLVEGIAGRFRLPRKRAERVVFLVAEHGAPEAYTSDWGDAAVRRLVRRAGEHLADLLTFAAADLTTRFPEKRAAAQARVEELRERIQGLAADRALRPELPPGLGGAVMAALGLDEGPAVGEHLAAVREAILEGQLPAAPTTAECLAFLAGRGGGPG